MLWLPFCACAWALAGNRPHHWPLATTLAALCEIVYTADCLNVLSLCLVSVVLGLKNMLNITFKLL